MKNKMLKGLIAAIVFQFLVLTGMYVKAALPLWIGTEIKVNTVPVDPRSLFRGNYARLGYKFSRIEKKHFSDTAKKLRDGEIVFVSLKADEKGIYKFSSASLVKPENGIFLQGRVENSRWGNTARIKYGIEAFFAPKVKALELERKMRNGGIAVLMVSSDGKARLKNIVSP